MSEGVQAQGMRKTCWLALLAPACASHSETPPATAVPRSTVIRIEPLQILVETSEGPTDEACTRAPLARSEPWIMLQANGQLSADGAPLGKLHADGRFVDLNGAERVSMNTEGRVEIERAVVTVARDGTVTVEIAGLEPMVSRVDSDGSEGFHTFAHIEDSEGHPMVRCTRNRIDPFVPELVRTAVFVGIIVDVLRSEEQRAAREGD